MVQYPKAAVFLIVDGLDGLDGVIGARFSNVSSKDFNSLIPHFQIVSSFWMNF
jgi:hypothetical protein